MTPAGSNEDTCWSSRQCTPSQGNASRREWIANKRGVVQWVPTVVLGSPFLMAMRAVLRGGKKMRPSFTVGRLAAFAVSILLASLHSATAEDSVAATRKLLYLERRKREPVRRNGVRLYVLIYAVVCNLPYDAFTCTGAKCSENSQQLMRCPRPLHPTR